MAQTVTLLTNGNGGTGAASVSTAPVTIPGNSFIIVSFLGDSSSNASGSAPGITMAGGTLAPNAYVQQVPPSGAQLTVWVASTTSAGATNQVFTFSPLSGTWNSSCAWFVFSVTGVKPVAPIETQVHVGSITGFHWGSGFGAPVSSNSRPFAVYAWTPSTGGITPQTGYASVGTVTGSINLANHYDATAWNSSFGADMAQTTSVAYVAMELVSDSFLTPSTDTGTFSEAVQSLTQVGVPSDGDSGGFTETQSVVATQADADSGTFSDSQVLTVSLTDADSALFSEAESLSVASVPVADGDQSSFSEFESLTVAAADDDPAGFVEAEAVAVGVLDDDPGVFGEAEAVAATSSDGDGGFSSERESVVRYRWVFKPPMFREGGVFGDHPLWRRYTLDQGMTVVVKDGVTEVLSYPDQASLDGYDKVYRGGYVYPLDDDDLRFLQSAGFAELIELEQYLDRTDAP